MQLDVAFNAKDYRALRQTKAWQSAEASMGRAASRLSGLVPQTQAKVLEGIGSGGAAVSDPKFTQPLDFDAAFGRKPKSVRVPKPAADKLQRRMDATNPRIARHTQKRMQDYFKKLTLPSQKQMQSIIARNVKITAQRAKLVGEALRPDPAGAASLRIGLRDDQVRSLDKLEDTLIASGQSPKQTQATLQATSDKMLAQRAQVIAVTEASAARANAQVEAWLALQEQGLIGPNATKQWVRGWEEICPNICAKVDGVAVPLADEWTLGNGKGCFAAGTAHPNCKCHMVLYDPDVDDPTPDGEHYNSDAFVDAGHFDEE